MKTFATILPMALALAACGQGDGTNISISGGNGSAGITNGVASIDLPNMKGELRLPKFQVDANNLDIDGVKLFPGSTVSNVDVNAGKNDDDGRVRIAFESPANAARVREYFRGQLDQAGFKTATSGAGLSGTTRDGKPFTLTLRDAGAGKTSGEMALGS